MLTYFGGAVGIAYTPWSKTGRSNFNISGLRFL